MQTHTYRSQMVQNKLSLAALLLFPILSGAQSYTATSRNASVPIPGPVTPVRATDFVSSIGVNVHCDVTTSPFRARFQEAKQLISGLGVKLVRAPGTDQFCVSSAQDLRRSFGIKTDFLMLPYEGSGVDDKFWMSAGGSYLANFLKNILGTDALASVEITNEVDVFYNLYRWHPNDLTTLVNSSTLPGSWGLYGPAIEAEAYSVMKSTPGLTQIPVYGPPLGYFAHGFAAGSMYGKVDFGTFHPYPYRGNTLSFPAPYDGIPQYFWQSNQPSVNIDEWPSAFQNFQPAFSSVEKGGALTPMVATETGYFTGTAQNSVSLETQANYIPRLLAEYFRHGIAKTFLYDFIDDGNDLANSEDNYGLVTFQMTPKPAYIALKSMLELLADTGPAFNPKPLEYSLAVQPSGAFTRTNYVHDLLVQKSDGHYYLLLWHEVSSAALYDSKNVPYPGTAADLHPPALGVTISLPSEICGASVSTYTPEWTLSSIAVLIPMHRLVVPATDRISLVELTPCLPATRRN